MSVSLALTGTPDPAEEDAVRDLLRASNGAATGLPRDRRALVVTCRDAAGAINGGLVGLTQWGWLYIDVLVVPDALRGTGLGGRILAMAEDEARARGCVGARLDTYSFQARPFYEKQGYTVAGAIADCPPGHTRYYMTKRLDAPAGEPWPDAAAPRATLALTDDAHDPVIGVLEDGLTAHNLAFAPHHGFRPLNLVVRRPGEARPAGGLAGYTAHRWLVVRDVWLPADLRGGGLGSALLARAEAEAAARGCIGVWLDTLSFQARPFYERHGYGAFGTLQDCPPGAARHFLMKRLDRAQGAA